MTKRGDILLVDDEPNTLASLARAFRLEEYEVTVCGTAARALELAKGHPYDLILSDVVMPGRDGLALLEDLRKAGVLTPVVMMSGQADIKMAVRAMALGAIDFLEKPISTDRLLLTVTNCIKLQRLQNENHQLRRRMGAESMIGNSDALRRVMEQLDRVSPTETRICIYGETGTGKELAARSVHYGSSRKDGPFITLNCAAVPADLIESELFGHEKGAFTGAFQRQIGKFEQAHHGTLLLDEIGDMPLNMQAKLLRVLEEGEVERIGGTKPVKVDARVLVATHRDLFELVEHGSFRRDLYHRVVVFPVTLPPLRERPEDIPLLIEHFARLLCKQNGWKPASFTADAMHALQAYAWPGNVRELKNMVERLLLMATSGTVEAATVELALPSQSGAAGTAAASHNRCGRLAERLAAFERETIIAELQRQHHHITNTAKALGLERSHLYKKCQQLGVDLRQLRAESGSGPEPAAAARGGDE
jgi:DNA-binding NtrC family response regulator